MPPPPPPPPPEDDGGLPPPPPPPPFHDEENPSSSSSSSDDDDDDDEAEEDESSSGTTSGSGSGSSSEDEDEETQEGEDEEQVIVVPEQDVVPTHQDDEEVALNDMEKGEEEDDVRTGVSFSDEAEYYEYNDNQGQEGGYGFDHGESVDYDHENAVSGDQQEDDLKRQKQKQAAQKQAQQLEREKRRLKKHRPGSCSSRKVFLLIMGLLLLSFIVIMITYVATKSSREPTPRPTASPTMAPTLSLRAQRFQDFETILKVHEATPLESLLDTTSPPYKALLWLVDEDPLMLTPRLSMNPIVLNDNHDILMRFAMATFYFATHDNNTSPSLIQQQREQQQQQGESVVNISGNKRRAIETNNTIIDSNQTLSMWTREDKWMTEAPTCDWYGVTCNETTDDKINIILLDLSNNNIAGTIPVELNLLLETLSHFNLSGNALQLTLPTNLYRMTQLTLLDLHDNQLTGELLNDFQFLDKLEYLDLSHNQFEPQTIPTTLTILPALRTLLLAHNQFTGSLDQIFGVNMEYLDLSDNKLSGTIPITFQDSPRWQGLWFNDNPSLTGVIPSGLCQVPVLEYDCFWNQMAAGAGAGGVCGCEDCSCDAIFGNSTNTNSTTVAPFVTNSTNTTTVIGASVPASTPTISPLLQNPLPTIASPFKEKTGNIFDHQGGDES